MKKLRLTIIVFLSLLTCSFSLAQNIIWQADFSTQADFDLWEVVDANADGVTWRFHEEGGAVYPYHNTNPADDWIISQPFVVNESTSLMVSYEYMGSFYSEAMEAYFGNSKDISLMQKKMEHADLKDKIYESCFFVDVSKGDTCYIAFRAVSPAYKLQLFLKKVEVSNVGGQIATNYPNRVQSKSGLTLAASHKYVNVNHSDTIHFAVFDEEIEVTDSAHVYCQTDNEALVRLTSTSFLIESRGDYAFFATYGQKTTSDVPLNVGAFCNIPVLPQDPCPQSKDYTKKMLLLQGTGARCYYCPNGIEAIHTFFSDTTLSKNVFRLAHHSYTDDDPLYCHAAELISNKTELHSYPNMMINFNKEWGTTGESTAGFINFLNSSIKAASLVPSATNLSLSSSYDEMGETINVSLGVKTSEAGLYRVHVVMLQDSVYARQNGAREDSHNIHNASVRDISPADGSGAYLDCGRTELTDSVYHYCCEFKVSDLVPYSYGYTLNVLKHVRLLAYTQKLDGTIDNVVSAPVGEMAPFEYNSDPNDLPTRIDSQPILTAPIGEKCEVYDLTGKLLITTQCPEQLFIKLTKGIYIIKRYTQRGVVSTKITIP